MGAVESTAAAVYGVPFLADSLKGAYNSFEKTVLLTSPNAARLFPVTSGTAEQMRIKARQQMNIDCERSINIAFVGAPGTGKSSLINAIRRMEDRSPEAAVVGDNKQTTMSPKEHAWPKHDHVKLWDLPGGGAYGQEKAQFKTKDYFYKKFQLYAFDALFLITDGTNPEKLDQEILKHARKWSVAVAIIHTKTDEALRDILNEPGIKSPDEAKAEYRRRIEPKFSVGQPVVQQFFVNKYSFHSSSKKYKAFRMDEADLVRYAEKVLQNRFKDI